MDNQYFCGLWRTTGFLMNFAAVLELVTIVAYIVVLAGGRQKRQSGWKLLGALLLVTAAMQCAAMAIVVSVLLGVWECFVDSMLNALLGLCV